MDLLISDPSLGLTESQCLVLAKNHTLAVSNVDNTAPANVWNFCATGVCNYAFANGTTGVLISPYAGSHTASVCQLGYSSAVDNNEYLEAAVIQNGEGNAGKGGPYGMLPDCPLLLPVQLPSCICLLCCCLPLPFTLPSCLLCCIYLWDCLCLLYSLTNSLCYLCLCPCTVSAQDLHCWELCCCMLCCCAFPEPC